MLRANLIWSCYLSGFNLTMLTSHPFCPAMLASLPLLSVYRHTGLTGSTGTLSPRQSATCALLSSRCLLKGPFSGGSPGLPAYSHAPPYTLPIPSPCSIFLFSTWHRVTDNIFYLFILLIVHLPRLGFQPHEGRDFVSFFISGSPASRIIPAT